MAIDGPALVLLHGGLGHGPAESLIAAARLAAARQSSRTALAADFSAVIAATDSPSDFDGEPGVLVDADDQGPFSLRERLLSLIERFEIRRPVVMGSGSLPLLGAEHFRAIAAALAGPGPACVTNNFYSADITGWTPGLALERVTMLNRDNALPRRLRDACGLPVVSLPRTTATQFDLDTPTDLAILALHPGSRAVESVACRLPAALLARLRGLLPLFTDREAELCVCGRVGSQAWQYLERETACRVRLYSEERGLATAPPGYAARSALGFLHEAVGTARFFDILASLGDATLLDTRVLAAHAGVDASREDRYQSDLGAWEVVDDPWLRDFTRGAAAAVRPVVLGGHSLVSGGLMALNDAAWTLHDAAREAADRGPEADQRR